MVLIIVMIHAFLSYEPFNQARGLSDLLKTNVEKGINGDDADLVKRRNAFGSNNYPRKQGRSFLVHFDALSLIGGLILLYCSFII